MVELQQASPACTTGAHDQATTIATAVLAMPRSKRKAVAARNRSGKDFEKTKVRLGKRKRSDSLVGGSAPRTKKIYVPPQQNRAIQSCSAKSDSIPEHVSRAREHFNVHARTSALTALARIFSDSSGASQSHVAHAALVLGVGIESLQDEAGGVRAAAVALILSVLQVSPSVKPFALALSSSLCAALSHIRPDVRESAARAVIRIFGLNKFSPSDVFTDECINPLPLLASMLGDVEIPSPKVRAAAANAITAISCWNSKRDCPRSGPFFYHSLEWASFGPSKLVCSLPLLRLDPADAGDIAVRTANMVLEYLPLSETFAGRMRGEVCSAGDALVAGAHALSSIACRHSLETKRAVECVRRSVDVWAREQVDGISPVLGCAGSTDVDVSLAQIAVALSMWEVAGRFACSRLELGAPSWATDSVAYRIMTSSEAPDAVREQVGAAWIRFRWEAVVRSNAWNMNQSRKEQRKGQKTVQKSPSNEDVRVPETLEGCDDAVAVFESILRRLLSRPLEATGREVWTHIREVPGVIARFPGAGQQSGDRQGADDPLQGVELECDSVLRSKALHRLLNVLCDIIKVYGVSAPPGAVESVGNAISSELLKCPIVLAGLDSDCLGLVFSVAGYCGLAQDGALLRLMTGKRGRWVSASCAARVVEAWLPRCTERQAGEVGSLSTLAAALVAISSALDFDDKGFPPVPTNECVGRNDLLSSATRIVRKIGVARGSIEEILSALGIPQDQVEAVANRCFHH